uniref:Hypotheticial protein n=1 Tax=Globodera pallida TaxID=36090 RepID=A0A183CRN6_GLOPA
MRCRLWRCALPMFGTFEKALPYDDDDNEYNYNEYNYNYDAFDDDFHYDYADIGYSFNVYGHGVANH